MKALLKKHLEYYHNSGDFIIGHKIAMSEDVRKDLIKQGNWLKGLYNGELIPFRKEQVQFIKSAQEVKEHLKKNDFGSLLRSYHSVNDFELTEASKMFLKLQIVDKIISISRDGKESEKFHKQLAEKLYLKDGLEKGVKPKREGSSIPKDNFNPFFHKRTKEPKINRQLFSLKHDLEYYLDKISGLTIEEKGLIRKKEFVWLDVFARSWSELNSHEQNLLLSLTEQFGNSSDNEVSLFQYFFKCVENINSKGRRTFTVKDNSFFSREDAKKIKKIMFSEMKKNHKS